MTSGKTEIARRTLIGATGSLLAAPMILRGTALAQENAVYISTYGGAWTAAELEYVFKPFTEKTGIRVMPVLGASLAKVKAFVQTKDYDYDVAGIEFFQAQADGLVEPVDEKVIDLSVVPDVLRNGYGFRGIAFSSVMVYRKDKFPNGGPKTWADFWDVKRFPGKRSLNPRANVALQFALLADGVPPDKIYPLDLDRAFKKLDEIKPHITVWWTATAQALTLMRDNEVDIMSMWNSDAQTLVDQGLPVQIEWHGADLARGSKYVVRGSPRAKNGFKLIEAFCDAKNLAGFCQATSQGSLHPDSVKYMSKEAVMKSPTSPEHLAVAVNADDEWLAPRIDKIKERFTQWMAT